MKPINTKNFASLEEALQNIQKRCSARLMYAHDILRIIGTVEKSLLLKKADWKGFSFTAALTFGGSIPGGYKGTPEATAIKVERRSNAWVVTEIWRCRAAARRETVSIYPHYTDEQKLKIVDFHVGNFGN